MNPPLSERFPRYRDHAPAVPVWCVTPQTPRTIHRYFDSSPFSPSGRLLVSTQLPYEDRLPRPGDPARIVVSDLVNGEERAVAETLGWDTQVGAHAQWGADDKTLLFNDVDPQTWRPFGVVFDLHRGVGNRLDGPIYAVSPDRTYSITPNLSRTGLVQAGYGVLVPREVAEGGDPEADGLYRTDLRSGAHSRLVSLRELADAIDTPLGPVPGEPGRALGFHLSLNRQGDRLLFMIRWVRSPVGGRQAAITAYNYASRPLRFAAARLGLRSVHRALRKPPMVYNTLLSLAPDGSDPRVVVPADRYAAGGHHPNWRPDGRTVLMNLMVDGEMRFVEFDADNGTSRVVHDGIVGSGHPTQHPDGVHILTDAYPIEHVSFGDGTVPLRWIDVCRPRETVLVRMPSRASFQGRSLEMRVDLHPAWNDTYTRVAFNGYAGGTRRVYVADLSEYAGRDRASPG